MSNNKYYLLWSTVDHVELSEWPRDLGIVAAQAAVHSPPWTQVHHFLQKLLPHVNLHGGSILAETEPCNNAPL